MSINEWYFEQGEEPLFADVLWSRPETKSQAGSFVLIGGNTHGFHSIFQAYSEIQSLGVGNIQVVLPDSLKKHTHKFFPEATYLQSTPSGSFSKKSFEELLAVIEAHDGLLIPGNIENNSETTLLFEQILASTNLPIAISEDAFDSLSSCWLEILKRPKTIVQLNLNQLQKLARLSNSETAVTSTIGKQQLIDFLHGFTLDWRLSILIEFENIKMSAHTGKVCATQNNQSVISGAKAGIYATQLPDTFFEAISSACVD
jgi:hypothetical protein